MKTAHRAIFSVLFCLVCGCGAVAPIVTDVGQAAACVISEAQQPGATFESVATACAGVTVTDVEAIIAAVLAAEKQNPVPSSLSEKLSRVAHR